MNPRKTHLYGVGTGKSGTHSIAQIFGSPFRSGHEVGTPMLMEKILDLASGRINDDKLRNYVLKRDRRLWLDVDSSYLNFFIVDKLVELFSDAKFILTIRNPYTWLDSFINQILSRPQTSDQKLIQLRDFRFRPDLYTHSQEELILKEKGLYTIDGYLSYWAHHNRTVINTVPKDRLLIVRTDKIGESLDEIATFAGISRSNLKQEKSHSFKAKAKFHLLDGIDREYLEYKVKEHCGDLMAQFFPEIQSKEDGTSVSKQ